MPAATTSVLFVCLGNICRSPMAEAVFVRAARDTSLGERLIVDSAGTAGHHVGESPHRSTLAVLRDAGIETTHRARQVTRADFERFAWIIAMDQANAADLRAMAPKASTARIELFRSFDEASPQNAEVPDPWGHPMDAFREVYTLCARASAGLVRAIVATAG
jgi:protein-tyrosine-phosphatase